MRKIVAFTACMLTILTVLSTITEFTISNNLLPIADAGEDQFTFEGENASFNVSGSYDSDGYIVRYEYDFGDGTNFIWEPTVQFTNGTDILVYITRTVGGYNRTWFDDDLPLVLEEEGFNVTVSGTDQISEINSTILANFDQLWILSTNYSSTGVFTPSEINDILSFQENGGGLLLMPDHTYMGASAATDANQISVNYNVTFSGWANHGHQAIYPFIVTHPLCENVGSIWGHGSEALITKTNPDVEIIGVHNGYNMIAVLDIPKEGRIVFDTSFTRVEDGGDPNGDDILNADNIQYAKNIAKWLGEGYVPESPPIIYHTYGDDGHGTDNIYTMILTVTDNEGGTDTDTCIVTVDNIAPSIKHLEPIEMDEGSLFQISATACDSGSDDLIFTWDFEEGPTITNTYYNDGAAQDPYPSPSGTYPFSAMDMVEHTFGDNGVYMLTLTVEDDDGGITTHSINITINNVVPSIAPFGPFTVDEGTPLSLMTSSIDQGSDDLTFTWEFEFGPTITNVHYNDGVASDLYPSPWGLFPFTSLDMVEHTYGDDGVYLLTLTVTDDDGGSAIYLTNITVNNVAPTIEHLEVYMYANISLKVAGEKYHSVNIYLHEDGTEIWWGNVTRHPGNPDEQKATITNVKLDMTKRYTAIVDYLPNDPRENGNVWGANPIWIEFTFEDGSQEKLHHTFNVRKSYWNSDHWNHIDPWEVEFAPHLIDHNVTFVAAGTDFGSDDLTFQWSFGVVTTYYNDGYAPDPYPSPDGIFPFYAEDKSLGPYTGPGSYTLMLYDDDGGTSYETLVIV